MAIDYNRNLCLETIARFIDHQYKCSFALSTARDILQDDTTCPYKCNIWIKNMHDYRNSLQEIDLTIGNETKIFNPCSRSYYNYKVNLSINCSSWNAMKYITWDAVCAWSINDAHCVHINNYCVCHCLPGYILANKKCLKNVCSIHEQCKGNNNSGVCENGRCTCSKGFTFIDLSCEKKMINIGGICECDWQCIGTEFANVCNHGICSCSPGYIQINRTCYMYQGNVTLNDPCELTEQCSQPFSVCFQGKCQCINGYFALDRKHCLKDTVPVGGFCSLHEQCTGSNNSGVCKNGRCTCTKGFTFINLACEENQPTSHGSLTHQQHVILPKETNIGVTLGSLFGGLIFGVIVTVIVTTLVYRRFKLRTRNREEPDVMFADNRACGVIEISCTTNKKQKVANSSLSSFSNETPGYATLQPTSPSEDGGDYSKLEL